MEGLTPYIVLFAAGVGALLGDGHGAILATTIVLGIILVVSLIGAASLARKQQSAQEELAELIAQGGAQWDGVPPVDPQSGIVPAEQHEERQQQSPDPVKYDDA